MAGSDGAVDVRGLSSSGQHQPACGGPTRDYFLARTSPASAAAAVLRRGWSSADRGSGGGRSERSSPVNSTGVQIVIDHSVDDDDGDVQDDGISVVVIDSGTRDRTT